VRHGGQQYRSAAEDGGFAVKVVNRGDSGNASPP